MFFRSLVFLRVFYHVGNGNQRTLTGFTGFSAAPMDVTGFYRVLPSFFFDSPVGNTRRRGPASRRRSDRDCGTGGRRAGGRGGRPFHLCLCEGSLPAKKNKQRQNGSIFFTKNLQIFINSRINSSKIEWGIRLG